MLRGKEASSPCLHDGSKLLLFISIPDAKHLPLSSLTPIELRLDLFPHWDEAMLEKILSRHITMLTYKATTPSFEKSLLSLLQLHPPFFDLPFDMSATFLQSVLTSYPNTRFVLSYHNFDGLPPSLEAIYNSMCRYPAFCYKIAAVTLSTNDALRMLLFSKKHPNVSTICMGAYGAFARVLGPVVGNLVNYACLNESEKTAPGQLSFKELHEVYRYPSLQQNTALYALIGDPVEQSLGHLYHNRIFQEKNLDAVYVKMRVTVEELPEFFSLAKELGFCGLSVTMPLKEAVIPFVDVLDETAQTAGAVNTLHIHKGVIYGTNTDGKGALDALEKQGKVAGKSFVILGAGGACRAIAKEALARGAQVSIFNRTPERAQRVGKELGCHFGALCDIPPSYDILVKCTPEASIDILPRSIVMDTVYNPKYTPFVQQALQKECTVVYGEEMFLQQAALQTRFWLKESFA